MDKDLVYAINAYYKLKRKFIEQRKKDKANVIKKCLKMNLKPNEIKEKVKTTVNSQKCIHCKKSQPGRPGTIFRRKDEKLKAYCNLPEGNKCDFDIEINIGYYESNDYLLDLNTTDLKESRQKIIKLKMDSLYGFHDDEAPEVLEEKFNEEVSNFNDSNYQNIFYLKNLYSITANSDKKNELENVEKQMFELIKQIKESNDNNEKVNIYINNLRPILDRYYLLKYDTRYVEKIDNTDIFNYITREFNISTLEFDLGENTPGVQKFEPSYGRK